MKDYTQFMHHTSMRKGQKSKTVKISALFGKLVDICLQTTACSFGGEKHEGKWMPFRLKCGKIPMSRTHLCAVMGCVVRCGVVRLHLDPK